MTGLVMGAGTKVLLKGLTPWGIAHAFALGTVVYGAFGAGGFALVCLYFLFGTAVSSLHQIMGALPGVGQPQCSHCGSCAVAAMVVSSKFRGHYGHTPM